MGKPTYDELMALLESLVAAIDANSICEDIEFTIVDGYFHDIEKLDRARAVVMAFGPDRAQPSE